MKSTSLFTAAFLSALLTGPAMAEPASFKALSHNRVAESGAQPAEYKVVRSAGMDKYMPYHARATSLAVDTEIASFEEADEGARGYVKPVRSDRIPSL